MRFAAVLLAVVCLVGCQKKPAVNRGLNINNARLEALVPATPVTPAIMEGTIIQKIVHTSRYSIEGDDTTDGKNVMVDGKWYEFVLERRGVVRKVCVGPGAYQTNEVGGSIEWISP